MGLGAYRNACNRCQPTPDRPFDVSFEVRAMQCIQMPIHPFLVRHDEKDSVCIYVLLFPSPKPSSNQYP